VTSADLDLAGRVALVTGGASGIGRATCELFVQRGASVMVADVDGERAAAAAAALGDMTPAGGGRVDSVVVDVAEADQVQAMVAATMSQLGGLDAAVNNAGTPGTYRPLADQELADWRRTVDINLTGTFLCLQAELAVMGPAGRGAIVNVASAAGLMGFANLPGYVASKHGVVGLTKSVALEFARGGGIRVNAVCPGNVRTPMLEGFAGGDEQALTSMGKVTPIVRLAQPTEIAEAIVWLCSDAASFVTGHALAVDGGVLAT
jgi:NAD(P)-dependent dehydrogenase (short-subunit alcohol dehydrogenase family)